MAIHWLGVGIDAKGSVKGANIHKKSVDKVSASGKRLSNSAKKTAGSVSKSSEVMKKAFIGIGGIVSAGLAINSLAAFDYQMSSIQAVSRASSSDMAKLRDLTKELGTTTSFTAKQAAEGAEFLARAGFTTDESLSSLANTLALARAGSLELGTAAEITTNTMRAFGIEAANSSRVTDILALSAASSNTNVEQLGESLKYSGVVASALGVDLETTAAATSVLANSYLKGSMAGTGLRKALLKLESPTKSGMKVLAKYGLTTNDVSITQHGLVKVLKTLKEKQIEIADTTQLVGLIGAPATQVMIQQADAVEELANQYSNAEGSAEKMRKTMQNNLKGSILQMTSAMGGLLLEVGDRGLNRVLKASIGYTRDFFLAMNGLLNPTTTAQKIIYGLGDAVTRLAPALLAAATGFLVFKTIPLVIAGITTAFKTLTVFMVTNPITAILIGLATLVIVFRKEIKQLLNTTLTFGDKSFSIMDMLRVGWKLLTISIKNIVNWFVTLKNRVISFYDRAKELFDKNASSGGVLGGFFRGIRYLWSLFKDFINWAINSYFRLANATIKLGSAIANLSFKNIGKDLKDVFSTDYVQKYGDAISNIGGRLTTLANNERELREQRGLNSDAGGAGTTNVGGSTGIDTNLSQDVNSNVDGVDQPITNAPVQPVTTDFNGGYMEQQLAMIKEAEVAWASLGKTVAEVWGPGGTLEQGIATAAADALVFGKDWRESLKKLVLTITRDLIAALIQTTIQRITMNELVNKKEVIGNLTTAKSAIARDVTTSKSAIASISTITSYAAASQATLTASMIASQKAIAIASAPAAASVSIATAGGAAVAGGTAAATALASYIAAVKASLLFEKGGAFEGDGIIRKPTFFNLGQAGENGAEAILPLSRTRDGSLGVRSEGSGGASSKATTITHYNNIDINIDSQNSEVGGSDESMTEFLQEQVVPLITEKMNEKDLNNLGHKNGN